MIAAGTEVYWTPNAANGTPGDRTLFGRTVGPVFVVNRNIDGVPVECAILDNNRLAPVSQLSRTKPQAKPRAESGKPTKETTGERLGVSPPCDLMSHDLGRAQDAPQGSLRTVPKTTRRADTQPLAPINSQFSPLAPAPCNVLAIDFLNVLVRAYHAGKPTETHAVRSMFQTVANAIRKLRPAHVVFAMDGGHKLRSELLPQYKAHRPESDPLLTAQKALAETAICVAGFQAIRVIDWEADDVLATLATQYSDTVIASCDKDLLAMTGQAIRCRVYHPWGEGQMVTSEEKIGLPPGQVTDYLALCGDTSDGIPGVVGIGPKTAVQLLTDYGSLEAIIVAAKLGNIKGATGQKIAAQYAAALTCRRVVELNTRLPLPALDDFSPVALWRQKLQDMRLGSVAAIMESLSGERFGVSHPCQPANSDAQTTRRADSQPLATEIKNNPSERELSAATTQAEQFEEIESGRRGLPDSATLFDQQSQVEGRSEPAHTNGSPPTNSTEDIRADLGTVAGGNPVSGADNPCPPGSAVYAKSGFTTFRESPPPPGTTIKPKFYAVWKDGSKWLIDPNTNRHTCFSDNPITEWRIDARGPIDPKTNAVRKP